MSALILALLVIGLGLALFAGAVYTPKHEGPPDLSPRYRIIGTCEGYAVQRQGLWGWSTYGHDDGYYRFATLEEAQAGVERWKLEDTPHPDEGKVVWEK